MSEQKEVRLLVLDIDEVATNRYTHMDAEVPTIDPSVAEMIRELSRKFNLQITLISTWADHYTETSLTSVVKLVEAMGFGRNVFADCPIVPKQLSTFRGDRMRLLFKELKEKNIKVTDYIIIEDSNDYYMEHMPHLVHVDPMSGFTVRDYATVCEYFSDENHGAKGGLFAPSGMYLQQDFRYKRLLAEDLPKLESMTHYKEGSIVYIREQDTFVRFTVDVEYCPLTKIAPVVLIGANHNAVVIGDQELRSLAQQLFISQKTGTK